MRLSHSRRSVVVAALSSLFIAAAGVAAGPAGATEGLDYVALGDSSAAGPLIPLQEPSPCLRSTKNWPKVVAAKLGANLTDVTCSGAVTGDMTGKQFGFVAPQFDALKPDTDLVTIAIGANDLSLGTVVPSCYLPCKSRLTSGGVDQLAQGIEATAPKVGAVLEGIHDRSPDARVVVVSYATYWKKGGCFGKDPVNSTDADYLQGTWDKMHAMLAEQAATHDAEYVDIRTPSADHGVCASLSEKWMEGLLPTSPAAPYHPNAKGMAASGTTIAAAIG